MGTRIRDEQQNSEDDIRSLIDLLASDDWEICKNASEALGKIGELAVPRLIAALNDSARWHGAVEALAQIGRPAVEPLISLFNEERLDSFAFDALSKIGKPAVQPLINALQDSDSRVRSWVVDTLGWLGDKRAIEPLKAALRDADPQVQKNAIQALDRMGVQFSGPKN